MLGSLLVGIVPPLASEAANELQESLQRIPRSQEQDDDEHLIIQDDKEEENTSNHYYSVKWTPITSVVNDPDEGVPALLMQAISEAPPDELLAAIQSTVQQKFSSNNSNNKQEEIQVEMWASAPAPLPLKPSPSGYDDALLPWNTTQQQQTLPVLDEDHDDAILSTRTHQLQKWGILVQPQLLQASQVQELYQLAMSAIVDAEASLAQYQPHLRVGWDFFCFSEMASRSSERFDLRLSPDTAAYQFVTQHVVHLPHLQHLLQKAMLVENFEQELDFDLSVVYSRPGAGHQGWHADGNHQTGARDAGWGLDGDDDNDNGWKTQLAAPYAICLFIPLIDLNTEVGFTQFWPGSHRHRALVGFGQVAELTQATLDGNCSAGDGIFYDYRLMHRGMPNTSLKIVRPVLQVVFKQKWYIERANYGTETMYVTQTPSNDSAEGTKI